MKEFEMLLKESVLVKAADIDQNIDKFDNKFLKSFESI
jgi:hypothetical protein